MLGIMPESEPYRLGSHACFTLYVACMLSGFCRELWCAQQPQSSIGLILTRDGFGNGTSGTASLREQILGVAEREGGWQNLPSGAQYRGSFPVRAPLKWQFLCSSRLF